MIKALIFVLDSIITTYIIVKYAFNQIQNEQTSLMMTNQKPNQAKPNILLIATTKKLSTIILNCQLFS